jgi:hypothetical protein
MNRLKVALHYAKKGIHVFPLQENSKVPLPGFHWTREATTDERQIKAWWGKNPNWNIGVAAEPSGLVIVDLDDKNGKTGSKEFATLRGENPIPDTLTVKTPSGGTHHYFIGDPVKSGTDRLAEGVDIKSGGGYVVGIGSEIDGKAYEVTNKAELAIVPDWLTPHLKPHRPKDPEAKKAIGELDNPSAIKAAVKHLEREPGAVSGAGGNHHTFKVACRILDFGLSMGVAEKLLEEHWNERCSPPWRPDELTTIVRNAWSYRSKPVGSDNPDIIFKGLGDDEPRPLIVPLAWPKEELLPRRRWLLGRSLLRGKVSQLVADGGIGKSTYVLQGAMAIVANRPDIVGQTVHEQTGVLVINNEDEQDEIYRRLYAARRLFGVSEKDLARLHIYSGVEEPFIAVQRDNKGTLQPKDFEGIKKQILQNDIGLVIADPFVEIHEGEENDNRDMNFVMRVFRKLAVECNIAVQIVHHTSKISVGSNASYAGNMNGSRGASAIVSAARVVQTLYNMSEDEAADYGVENPFEYVRLDDAKANLSMKSRRPTWFKKTTVELMNGDEAVALKLVELASSHIEERDVIADLLPRAFGEGEVSARDIAGWLIHNSPEYRVHEEKPLAAEIKKLFAKPFTRNGWKFTLTGNVLELTEVA